MPWHSEINVKVSKLAPQYGVNETLETNWFSNIKLQADDEN